MYDPQYFGATRFLAQSTKYCSVSRHDPDHFLPKHNELAVNKERIQTSIT